MRRSVFEAVTAAAAERWAVPEIGGPHHVALAVRGHSEDRTYDETSNAFLYIFPISGHLFV